MTQREHFQLRSAILVEDDRGYLRSSRDKFSEAMPFLPMDSYVAFSRKQVFRGLHLQTNNTFKYYQLISGSVVFYCVCCNQSCSDFGIVTEIPMESNNFQNLYLPPGIATGYLTKTESLMLSFMSERYSPENELQINPINLVKDLPSNSIISQKDRSALSWQQNLQIIKNLKFLNEFTVD